MLSSDLLFLFYFSFFLLILSQEGFTSRHLVSFGWIEHDNIFQNSLEDQQYLSPGWRCTKSRCPHVWFGCWAHGPVGLTSCPGTNFERWLSSAHSVWTSPRFLSIEIGPPPPTFHCILTDLGPDSETRHVPKETMPHSPCPHISALSPQLQELGELCDSQLLPSPILPLSH